MNMQIDKSMMEAYQQRWQVVADYETAEKRQASIAQRWKQLNSLMRMAAALGLELDRDEEEIEVVWQRWNKLKDMYLSENQK